jgi:hypothetical protein
VPRGKTLSVSAVKKTDFRKDASHSTYLMKGGGWLHKHSL